MPRRQYPDSSIGDRVRARRELRGWTIRYAASRAGISHTTWMRVEKGERRADRFMVVDLAAALECSVSDLTGQPHITGDRQLEAAHARVETLWRALLEIAPDEPPTREVAAVEALRLRMDLLDSLRTRSDYAGVGQVLPDLLLDLHTAAQGPDGAEALRMLIDATNTARGTLRGLGYLAEAVLAAERCRQVAEVLGEPVPLAVADWARANAAAGSGSYTRSHTLVTRAADELQPHLAEDGAMAMLGMLHLSAAHASLRSAPDEAFAHLDEARDLAERTGEAHQYWMYFGPTNVGIWRMGAYVDAGEHGRAVEAAGDIQPTVLDSADRRATFYVELSRAFTDFGGARDQDAQRALLTAERLAPQRVRSYTAARSTARFLLDRSERGSALRGLCQRMGVSG